MQQAVLSDEGNKRVVLGEGYGSDILKHAPYPATTPEREDRNEPKFWVVNDIHAQRFRSSGCCSGGAPKQAKPDFVCLNGDLLTSIESEEAAFRRGILAFGRRNC